MNFWNFFFVFCCILMFSVNCTGCSPLRIVILGALRSIIHLNSLSFVLRIVFLTFSLVKYSHIKEVSMRFQLGICSFVLWH